MIYFGALGVVYPRRLTNHNCEKFPFDPRSLLWWGITSGNLKIFLPPTPVSSSLTTCEYLALLYTAQVYVSKGAVTEG